jgi:hypothetical protein
LELKFKIGNEKITLETEKGSPAEMTVAAIKELRQRKYRRLFRQFASSEAVSNLFIKTVGTVVIKWRVSKQAHPNLIYAKIPALPSR